MIWIDTNIENGTGIVTVRGLTKPAELMLISASNEVLKKELVPVQDQAQMEVPYPALWDPEHPNLYKYKLIAENRIIRGRIGFRKLAITGRTLFWNDMPVKLYGICYRQHRADPEGTRKDLEMFKKANINFIRSIYGSFDSYLLDLADEMGFFVEDTAPFWGVGTSKKAEQNLPHLEEKFLQETKTLLSEGMHTSVLIWSLGQDCAYGGNFRSMRRYIKSIDPVRPVTFHLPMSVPEEEDVPDIWPCTYIDCRQDLGTAYDQMIVFHTPGAEDEIGYMTASNEEDVPVLHEAWSPVPFMNRDEICRDPAIHEFWGRSIRAFADKAAMTKGCLGGAVPAGVDEDGSLEELKDYHWGILDEQHRPKPEYQGIRDAYAPAALNVTRKGAQIEVAVQNRYCFTSCHWSLLFNGNNIAELAMEPGTKNVINLEASGEENEIQVVDLSGRILSFWFERTGKRPEITETLDVEDSGQNPFLVSETEDTITAAAKRTRYEFSKKSGLLSGAWIDGRLVLLSGPWINLTGMHPGSWENGTIDVRKKGCGILAHIRGEYHNTLKAEYSLLLDDEGRIRTNLKILELERHMPHVVKTYIGLSSGGLSEKGITWILPQAQPARILRKFWKDPQVIERGAAHEIIRADISVQDGYGAEVTSDGSVSVMINPKYEKTGDSAFQLIGTWFRMDDYCGDYQDTQIMSKEEGAQALFSFTGTGIRLYGPLEYNCGIAEISVDEEHTETVSEFLPAVDRLSASRGYEKRYGVLLYEISGLEEKKHTLKIHVTGRKEADAQEAWFAVDYAEVSGDGHSAACALSILSAYNYPRLTFGCKRNDPVLVAENETETYALRIGRI